MKVLRFGSLAVRSVNGKGKTVVVTALPFCAVTPPTIDFARSTKLAVC